MGKVTIMATTTVFLAMLPIFMTLASSNSVPRQQLMPSPGYPNAVYGRPVQLNRLWNMKTSRCGEKDIWLRSDCQVVTENFINFPQIQNYLGGYQIVNVGMPFFASCVFTETTGVIQACGKAHQIVERKKSVVGFCSPFCKPIPVPNQVFTGGNMAVNDHPIQDKRDQHDMEARGLEDWRSRKHTSPV